MFPPKVVSRYHNVHKKLNVNCQFSSRVLIIEHRKIPQDLQIEISGPGLGQTQFIDSNLIWHVYQELEIIIYITCF